MKIAVLIGARPQFIKAAPLCKDLESRNIDFVLIHSGQHYDFNLSDVFFEELGIPRPNLHLEIPRTTEAEQRDFIHEKCQAYLSKEGIDVLLVFGDTTTTLAGAYAARDLDIPLIHVEAGLRSFNNDMPEEYNRIHTDRLSTVLCCPSETSVAQLKRESIFTHQPGEPYSPANPLVVNVGDIMMDNLRLSLEELQGNEIKGDPIHDASKSLKVLVTLHRQSNVDNPQRLQTIIQSMTDWAAVRGWKYIFPVHPRTQNRLNDIPEIYKLMRESEYWDLREPVGFKQMLQLQLDVAFAVSDSGGLPKEMHFFNKPTIIMRTETEWVELIEHDWARCVEPHVEALENAWQALHNAENRPTYLYGSGHSAEAIGELLASWE